MYAPNSKTVRWVPNPEKHPIENENCNYNFPSQIVHFPILETVLINMLQLVKEAH